MIAVDTSALMAILLDEPEGEAYAGILEVENEILISAGTVAEALIATARRNIGSEMEQLIDGIGSACCAGTRNMGQRQTHSCTEFWRLLCL